MIENNTKKDNYILNQGVDFIYKNNIMFLLIISAFTTLLFMNLVFWYTDISINYRLITSSAIILLYVVIIGTKLLFLRKYYINFYKNDYNIKYMFNDDFVSISTDSIQRKLDYKKIKTIYVLDNIIIIYLSFAASFNTPYDGFYVLDKEGFSSNYINFISFLESKNIKVKEIITKKSNW